MHLGINDLQRIQILDIDIGNWITHLRNGPAVTVTANSTLHMKKWETLLDPKTAISVVQGPINSEEKVSSPMKRKAAKDEVKDEVIDLTISDTHTLKKRKNSPKEGTGYNDIIPSSPLQAYTDLEDVADVGSRPIRLPRFPAKTVGEMVTRIEWIVAKGPSDESVKRRYSKMFSCDYAKSTYYLHQRAWRWLRDNGVLDEARDDDLWGPLVRAAKAALAGEKEENEAPPTRRALN